MFLQLFVFAEGNVVSERTTGVHAQCFVSVFFDVNAGRKPFSAVHRGIVVVAVVALSLAAVATCIVTPEKSFFSYTGV